LCEMSYGLGDDGGYRMPTHFGPLPGPRWAPDGGWRAADETQCSNAVWATFEVERDDVGALLPAGFEPSDRPDLTVEIKNMANIAWLGGRGYRVVTVTTGVRRIGAADRFPAVGRFKLVLWEDHADPIITGRDELGYPKLYAEISPIQVAGITARASASWDGFTFLVLDLSELAPGVAEFPAGHSYHLRYLPRTGIGRGHEIIQTIVTLPGQGPLTVVERLRGRGDLHFRRGTFTELPTLLPIVDALAGLRLGDCRAAGLARTRGTTDLRDQVVLERDRPTTSDRSEPRT
jgi:hypothetical protein